MRGARRRADRCGGRRPAVAEADVLLRRQREDRRVLRHQADPLAQRRRIDAAEIDAVDAHAARGRIVEAHEEREERRLAGAGRADERDALAAPHIAA